MVATCGVMDSKKKPGSRPALRQASFEDHTQITLLGSRHNFGRKSYAEWKHLWVDNPVYTTFPEYWPIGWVLENADKQIVGYIGNIPLLYEYQGRKIIAASAHGWAVDLDYRSYSILLMSRYFSQKNVDLYLNTTVNSAGSRAFSIFRSSKVPVGAWDQADFWITNYHGFATSWLKRSAPTAQVLSRPVSLGLHLSDKIIRKTLSATRRCERRVEVEQCETFDDRFNDFWEILRRRNSHRLLAVRTREALEWHFRTAILQNRLWIFTITNGSSLKDYALFYRQDNAQFGLRRVQLVDFQTLDEVNHDSFVSILSAALNRCQSESIDMLECIGLSPSQREIVGVLTPHQRHLSSWFYYYKAKDLGFAETLKNPSVWAPSGFDGDASL
jgi:hypothetical protein